MRFVAGQWSGDADGTDFRLIDLEHLERGGALFDSRDSAEFAAQEANRNPDWADGLMWTPPDSNDQPEVARRPYAFELPRYIPRA